MSHYIFALGVTYYALLIGEILRSSLTVRSLHSRFNLLAFSMANLASHQRSVTHLFLLTVPTPSKLCLCLQIGSNSPLLSYVVRRNPHLFDSRLGLTCAVRCVACNK